MRLLVPIAFLVSLSQPPAAATTFDHSAYDQVLRRHVSSEGLVAYAALHSDRSGLDAYVDSLARYSPDSDPALFPDRDHELAYWIMPTTPSFCAALSTPIPSPASKTPSSSAASSTVRSLSPGAKN